MIIRILVFHQRLVILHRYANNRRLVDLTIHIIHTVEMGLLSWTLSHAWSQLHTTLLSCVMFVVTHKVTAVTSAIREKGPSVSLSLQREKKLLLPLPPPV